MKWPSIHWPWSKPKRVICECGDDFQPDCTNFDLHASYNNMCIVPLQLHGCNRCKGYMTERPEILAEAIIFGDSSCYRTLLRFNIDTHNPDIRHWAAHILTPKSNLWVDIECEDGVWI